MEYINDAGIDPTKLSVDELYQEVVDYTDLELGEQCATELFKRDEAKGIEACLKVLNLSINDDNYGDKFYQAGMWTQLFLHDEDKAIEYVENKYSEVELYVLAEMIRFLTTDDEKHKEIRNTLKSYIEEKGKDYFNELKQFGSTENVIAEFLESFNRQ